MENHVDRDTVWGGGIMKEKKIVFGTGDILNLRLRCQKCPGELALPAQQPTVPFQWRCPLCGDEWKSDRPEFAKREEREVLALIHAIQFLGLAKNPTPFDVWFEIDDNDP